MNSFSKGHPLSDLLRRAGITKRYKGCYFTGRDKAEAHGYWDGGSRGQLWRLNLDTGASARCRMVTDPPQFGGGPTIVPIDHKGRTAIVNCGTSCGKPAYPMVYLPDSALCPDCGALTMDGIQCDKCDMVHRSYSPSG